MLSPIRLFTIYPDKLASNLYHVIFELKEYHCGCSKSLLTVKITVFSNIKLITSYVFLFTQISRTQLFSCVVFHPENGLHIITISYESGEAVHSCAFVWKLCFNLAMTNL